jgi:hypothetical protein
MFKEYLWLQAVKGKGGKFRHIFVISDDLFPLHKDEGEVMAVRLKGVLIKLPLWVKISDLKDIMGIQEEVPDAPDSDEYGETPSAYFTILANGTPIIENALVMAANMGFPAGTPDGAGIYNEPELGFEYTFPAGTTLEMRMKIGIESDVPGLFLLAEVDVQTYPGEEKDVIDAEFEDHEEETEEEELEETDGGEGEEE